MNQSWTTEKKKLMKLPDLEYRPIAVNIPPLKEEISDFQIKSGEISFSGENSVEIS